LQQNAIKLCNVIITGLSHPPEPTDSAQATLAEVPTPHGVLDAKALEQEGEALLGMFVERLLHRSQHKVSPPVLVALVTELSSIARSRPQFVAAATGAVVAASSMVSDASQRSMKGWEDQKPSSSHVKTMSDACKRAMISLVKLPGTDQWHNEMAQRLMQFGAKDESKEIMRNISRKSKRGGDEAGSSGREKRRRTADGEASGRDAPSQKRSHEQITGEAVGSGRHDPRARTSRPAADGPPGSNEGQFGPEDPWPQELVELIEEARREEAWQPARVAEVLLANFGFLPPAPPGPAPPIDEPIAEAIKPLAQIFQLTKLAVSRPVPVPQVPPPPPPLPEGGQVAATANEAQITPFEPNPVQEAAHAAAALQRVLMSGGWLARLLTAAGGQTVSDGVMRLRAVLLTRMAGLLPDDGAAHKALLDYIGGNRTGRMRLALHWLYQAPVH